MAQEQTGPAGWPGADLAALVTDWWKPFFAAPATLTQTAPGPAALGPTLVQPILPGWSFGPNLTINSLNSTAPQTEVEVVQRHSYGRQLGRINDVLTVLVGALGEGARDDPRVLSFLTMIQEIDEVKLETSQHHVDRLRTDLQTLRIARPQEYQRLRASLRTLLEED